MSLPAESERELERALERLERGGVVAAPTETFYGLLADARSGAALDQLSRLKPRGADKGVGLMIGSQELWPELVVGIPEAARVLAGAFWPGPLSIVLPAAPWLDPRLVLDGSVAVRCPGTSLALELCRRWGGPLTATSANLPGARPVTTGQDATVALAAASAGCELFVMRGSCVGGAPSTLVVPLSDGGIRIVREGAVEATQVQAALDQAGIRPRS